jgi:hypothetical protein
VSVSELEHPVARPTSTLLLALCALYALHLGAQIVWALEPEVSSRGLTRDYPAPQQLEGGAALLDPLTRPLPAELKRRYQLSDQLEEALGALLASWAPQLTPQARLAELEALLTSHALSVRRALITQEAPLPLLLTPASPSPLAQALTRQLTQSRERERASPVALLIARYAGVWVWFEPSVGVLLAELPAEWRELEGLSIEGWREVRW